MPDDTNPAKLSDATREADRRDAHVHGHADREPTPEEVRIADEKELDPQVAESAREQYERGAQQKGEGRID